MDPATPVYIAKGAAVTCEFVLQPLLDVAVLLTKLFTTKQPSRQGPSPLFMLFFGVRVTPRPLRSRRQLTEELLAQYSLVRTLVT